MGIPSINSLANMEYMLYGGASGLNSNCPSYINGYKAADSLFNPYYGYYNNPYGNYFNPTFGGYYNNQTNFGQSVPSIYAQSPSTNPQASNTSFQQGITQDDMDKLADYYAKNNALEEGFMGAATGGLSWMAFEHAQSIVHPINAYKGMKAVSEVFKDMPKEFAKQNAALLQEAQIAVQQAVRDTGKKGWWSGWLRRSINVPGEKNAAIAKENMAKINELLNKMKTAAKNGNVKEMAEITERLQAARGMDGKIAGLLSGRKTVAERLSSKADSIKSGSENIIKMNEAVIGNNFGNLAKSAFKKDFMGFMLFETAFNIGKIMTAFKKDTSTGIKQTGQSVGKSALGTAGWCLGRAAGTWLGAKAGAAIGTAVCPGAGTAVGALVGLTVGSIGMWAGHKLGNAIFGHDVADKVEAKQMAQSQEGQAQLIQFAMQKAQEGKTDQQTNQIVSKALNMYA